MRSGYNNPDQDVRIPPGVERVMSVSRRGEAPGIGYGFERLWRMAFPKIKVTPPAPGIVCERNVGIRMRDGTTLRVNVFRPRSAPGTVVFHTGAAHAAYLLVPRTS